MTNETTEIRKEVYDKLRARLEDTLKRNDLSNQMFDEVTLLLIGLDLVKEHYIDS